MTNPTPQAQAGWYPVSPGSNQLRWWDGTQWTEYMQSVGEDAASLKAPEGTDPNTVWAWLIALTPLVSLVGGIWYLSTLPATFGSLIADSSAAASSAQALALIYTPAYFGVLGLSLIGYAAAVVFGWLDWRALKARGVPRPFHWAWSFLEAPLVYIIGRTVVARRRTGRGLGPLWLLIAVVVVGAVIGISEGVALFGSIAANLPTGGTY